MVPREVLIHKYKFWGGPKLQASLGIYGFSGLGPLEGLDGVLSFVV